MEPIVELLQQYVDGSTAELPWYAIFLDVENAFNLMNRKWVADAIKKHAPQYSQLAKFAYQSASILGNSAYEVLSNSQGKAVLMPQNSSALVCAQLSIKWRKIF